MKRSEKIKKLEARAGSPLTPALYWYWKDCDFLLSEVKRLRGALEGVMEAAEFGNSEESPPGFWDSNINNAKEALSDDEVTGC